MSRTLELAGWVLAVGGVAAAAIARHRMANLTDAVARACHELRGPLTAARLGLLLAFRSGQLEDSRLRALELDLGRATLALEDLTLVSTVERSSVIGGREEVDVAREEVDVARLLAESVEAWRGLANAHGAELRLVETAGAPIVLGERLRLAQAIGNLVANAVEHGGDSVELRCRSEADAVRIEVTDDGNGLPDSIAALTSRRRRAGSRRGHGLASAGAIASAHGGRLAAAAGERGATVVLELPRAQDGLGAQDVPAAGALPAAGEARANL